MPRGIPKKVSAEFAKNLEAKDPTFKYITKYENWKEKHSEMVQECEEGDSLMAEHYQAWVSDVVNGSYGQKMFDMAQNAIDIADNPFSALRSIVEYGLMPPPTLVYVIDDLFLAYTLGMGYYNWEDICFGKPKRGIGNYAARSWPTKLDNVADFDEWVKRHAGEGEKKSLQEHAEAFFENKRGLTEMFAKNSESKDETQENPDIENFLRRYRRWKSKAADT